MKQTIIDAGNRRYTITEWSNFNKPLVTVNYRVMRDAKPYGAGHGLTSGYSATSGTCTRKGYATLEEAHAAIQKHAEKPYGGW